MINYRQALLYLGFEDRDFILQNDNDERGTFVGAWLSDLPQPTQAQIEAAHAEWEAEYAATEYKRLRAPEYPAIGDQLDAILKHLNYRRTQGDELVQEMDDIIGDWLAVKARFPKNG
jgi:hypothetical protein